MYANFLCTGTNLSPELSTFTPSSAKVRTGLYARIQASMASQPSTQRRQDRAITFLTQEEVQRLFSAIKTKRDRAIFAAACGGEEHLREY